MGGVNEKRVCLFNSFLIEEALKKEDHHVRFEIKYPNVKAISSSKSDSSLDPAATDILEEKKLVIQRERLLLQERSGLR